MLDDVPHIRGRHSGALIATGGLAALDCATESLTAAGDHLLIIGRVLGVPYAADAADPLIRFRGRYLG
jgi:flavin reductase (DIM6/NTAB) family NADH-FMN oxidoreductase RutF